MENRICFYCYQPATTKDHIVPISKGGGKGRGNTVDCCKLCNNAKSNSSQEDFIMFLNFVREQGVELHNISRKQRREMKKRFLNKTGIAIGAFENIVDSEKAKHARDEFAPNLMELQKRAGELNKHIFQ